MPDEVIILDTSGLSCPEPVMLLHRTIRKAASGQVIRVIATDPATRRDIPGFCQHLGHELLENTASDHPPYIYLLRRK